MEKTEKSLSCKECPLYNKRLVPGVGPKDARLVIIGEAPDASEEEFSAPFVGKAGQLLDKLLSEAGLDRKQIYITNVVACRPTDSSGNNITPSADIVKRCGVRLRAELADLRPTIILLLGNVAVKYFFGNSKNVTNSEGIPLKDEETGFTFVATYHPTALLRDPSKINRVRETLRRVKEWLNTDPFNWDFSKYKLLYSFSEIMDGISFLQTCSEFSCDLETSDITPDSVIMTIAFSTGDYTIGFPFRKPDLSSYWSESERTQLIQALQRLFQTDNKKIFHNAQFDLAFLKREFSIECKNLYWDTMVFAHLLDETLQTYSLKSLCWKFLGKGGYASEYRSYAFENRPVGVDTDIVLRYNCADAETTFLLYKKMVEISKERPKLAKLFHRLCIPIICTLVDTHIRGIKIDVSYIETLRAQYEKDLDVLTAKIHEVAGTSFNINSTQALSKVLFEDLKLPVLYRTAKGSPSTDTETLSRLEQHHAIIPLILEYRKKKKLLSTYFENFLVLKDEADCLHTEYLLTGTATGRLSSRNPNLQNIPRDKEVKDIFIARDGYFLAEFDFKQAELRMLCHYAQDAKMRDDFNSGFDVLKYIASKLYNIPVTQVSDEQRRLTKFVVYGLMYGRSAKSIASAYNISLEEATRIVDTFFNMYDNVKRWFKEVIIIAKKQGYLQNFFGRIRQFPGINSRDPEVAARAERQALNFLPQSTAADYTLFKAATLHPILRDYDTYLVLTVHDSLVYEIPIKYAFILHTIRSVINKPIKGMFLSIPTDCSVGFRLGSLEEITDINQLTDILRRLKE